MKNSIIPHDSSPEAFPLAEGNPSAPAHYTAQHWSADAIEEEEKGGGGAKLKRYWAAIKRFWWLVSGLTAIGTAVGLVATRYVKAVYEAQGAVWISDVSTGNGGGGGALRNAELLPNGSWIELMKNFAVVDSVVAQKHLWYTPKTPLDSAVLTNLRPTRRTMEGEYSLSIDAAKNRYVLSETKRGVVEQGFIGDSIGRKVGFAWMPDASMFASRKFVNFTVSQPRPVALRLVNQLEVIMPDNSNFLKLTLTGSEKWQTADILNAWMTAFVDKAAELRRRNLALTATVLESQRTGAESAMHAAENALQEFRTKNSTEPREGASVSAATGGGGAGDALLAGFMKLQSEYADVQRDRQALEDVAASARQGAITPEQIIAIPASASAPSLLAAVNDLLQKQTQLRELRRSYTDDFPAVRSLITAITQLQTQTIPTIAAEAARVLTGKEKFIASKLVADSAKLGTIPTRSIDEARLRRDLAVAENLYTSLENRYQTTRLGAASTIPDVNILYPALSAASSQTKLIIMLVGGGIFGSLIFGIFVVLLLDTLDPRFRYPEQITDELKLDVLGAVPAIPKPEDIARDPEAMLQSVEAFRGLRMNLHHAFDAPPVMVTISSPGAGDGKSMVSSNLALSFAEAGYRTLLIDGDIRRGKLHNVFGVDRRPGLLDYLAGDVELHAVMRDVPTHARLTVIPSGTRRHRGPELLTSARLPTLLSAARSRFDVILVDSAPLAAGVDAYALGVVTGSMVLVMRTGVTDRRVAKAKLKLLERVPVRMLGAIVNAVPAAGLYTEYSYLYGYSPDVDMDMERAEGVPALQSVDVSTS